MISRRRPLNIRCHALLGELPDEVDLRGPEEVDLRGAVALGFLEMGMT